MEGNQEVNLAAQEAEEPGMAEVAADTPEDSETVEPGTVGD